MTAAKHSSSAWVRVTNNGDHMVVCDVHGVICWHLRSYRFALAVARSHKCDNNEGE